MVREGRRRRRRRGTPGLRRGGPGRSRFARAGRPRSASCS